MMRHGWIGRDFPRLELSLKFKEKNTMSTVTDQDMTNLQKIYFEELAKLEEYRREEKPELEYNFAVLTSRLGMRMVINSKHS